MQATNNMLDVKGQALRRVSTILNGILVVPTDMLLRIDAFEGQKVMPDDKLHQMRDQFLICQGLFRSFLVREHATMTAVRQNLASAAEIDSFLLRLITLNADVEAAGDVFAALTRDPS